MQVQNANQGALAPSATYGGLKPGVKLGSIQSMLVNVARQHQLDPGTFLMIAHIETGGSFNPNARNTQSGASGLFQFIPATAAQYGLRGSEVFDPQKNAHAGARLTKDNLAYFQRKMNRSATAQETYLLLQQGMGGGLALIRAGGQERAVDVLAQVYKNRGTALKAVTGNGHAADVSVEAFRQSWYRKASALLARYGNRFS